MTGTGLIPIGMIRSGPVTMADNPVTAIGKLRFLHCLGIDLHCLYKQAPPCLG